MTRLSVGIDPGTTGAFAVVDVDRLACVSVRRLPVTEHGWGGRTKYHIEPTALMSALRTDLDGRRAETVSIERQIPKIGKRQLPATTFSVGDSLGVCRTVAALFSDRVLIPRPQDWQPDPGDDEGWTKTRSRLLAAALFPDMQANFARSADHDLADAALLGYHAAMVARGCERIADGCGDEVLTRAISVTRI